ncbi:MAG: c-type cytochrome domain-containing protein [Cytophagales bacterium]|nr:c-type cytochrome domain-containing protein [Cytophagales bacterium]
MTELSIMTGFWLWQFLGRLHPLIVHFPISLLVVALIVEIYSWRKKDQTIRSGLYLILFIGTLTAIISCVFGILLKDQDEYASNTLTIHQWTGIATTIMSIATLYLFRLSGKRPQLIKVYRAFLVFTVLGVGVAGHLGASLTHGADYLTEVLPLHRNNAFSGDPNFDLTSFKNNSGSQQRADQIAAINIEVRSIFAHNCYKCHSAEKTKGQLRLDNKELVMRGGKHGEIIEPGHPEKSELIRRLLLPREDEESMPPKGKTLSEKEIAILDLWIKSESTMACRFR